jgi:hypothetical protein
MPRVGLSLLLETLVEPPWFSLDDVALKRLPSWTPSPAPITEHISDAVLPQLQESYVPDAWGSKRNCCNAKFARPMLHLGVNFARLLDAVRRCQRASVIKVHFAPWTHVNVAMQYFWSRGPYNVCGSI